MENSIFKIITTNGSCTGFQVKGFEFLITNYQMVKGHREIAIENQNKHRIIGLVIYINPRLDIAFVKIPSQKVNTSKISIDASLPLKDKDKINVFGFPLGLPLTVNEGIISSSEQKIGNNIYLQTDAAVNQGNIGGPMLNEDAQLLAITTTKEENVDNIGFGIPYIYIKKAIAEFDADLACFQVKCPSCNSIVVKKTDFCHHCGHEIDSSIFDNVTLSHLATFVEHAILALDFNPILARSGRDCWEFYQGSALVKMFVYKNDYLLASSKLNKLTKTNLLDVFTYLLEDHHYPYTLGIVDNHIYLSYRIHLSDIYSQEVSNIEKNLANLALKADDLDNFFHDEFGCAFALESKIVEN